MISQVEASIVKPTGVIPSGKMANHIALRCLPTGEGSRRKKNFAVLSSERLAVKVREGEGGRVRRAGNSVVGGKDKRNKGTVTQRSERRFQPD